MGNGWSNAGGCGLLHPFNEEKRRACEEAKAASAKNVSAQADLVLAQAALEKSKQSSTSWTAGQTAMVVGAALIGITLMIVVIAKSRSKKN
jgi:hypothetical protein